MSEKLTLSCDTILERELALEALELLVELFEPSEIYTLVHNPGQVLGQIEQRRIRSSFLSHQVKNKDQLSARAFMVPTAAKRLGISCRYETIINISSGLSHGIAKCDNSKQVTYLLQDFEMAMKRPGARTLSEKIFARYLESWSKDRIRKQVDELLVSSEQLKRKYEGILDREVEVVYPFVKLRDFPVIPSPTFTYDHYVIAAESVNEQEAREVMRYMREQQVKFIFAGRDEHLSKLKSEDAKPFFGERCSGELAPLLAGCRGLIMGSMPDFPRLALCTLSTGRPVIAQKGGRGEEFLEKQQGVFWFDGWFDEAHKTAMTTLAQAPQHFEAKALHTQTQKFGDLKFKHIFRNRYGLTFSQPTQPVL